MPKVVTLFVEKISKFIHGTYRSVRTVHLTGSVVYICVYVCVCVCVCVQAALWPELGEEGS